MNEQEVKKSWRTEMTEYIRQILDIIKLDKSEKELEEMLYGIFKEIEDRYRTIYETRPGSERCFTERDVGDNQHISKSRPSENYKIPDEDQEYIGELRDTKIDNLNDE
jgi:hypothetical protein